MADWHAPPVPFGVRLRDLRRKNRLSQQLLAEHLGLSQRKVSDIETGRRTPTLQPEQYLLLSEILNVPLAELFGTRIKVQAPSRFGELIELAPDLTDHEIEVLVGVARQFIARAGVTSASGN